MGDWYLCSAQEKLVDGTCAAGLVSCSCNFYTIRFGYHLNITRKFCANTAEMHSGPVPDADRTDIDGCMPNINTACADGGINGDRQAEWVCNNPPIAFTNRAELTCADSNQTPVMCFPIEQFNGHAVST